MMFQINNEKCVLIQEYPMIKDYDEFIYDLSCMKSSKEQPMK